MLIVNPNRLEKLDMNSEAMLRIMSVHPHWDSLLGDILAWCLLEWQGEKIVHLMLVDTSYVALDWTNASTSFDCPELSYEETCQIRDSFPEYREIIDRTIQRIFEAQCLWANNSSIGDDISSPSVPDFSKYRDDMIDDLYHGGNRASKRLEWLYQIWLRHHASSE